MKSYKFWLALVLTLLVVNSAVLATMWFHQHPPKKRHSDNLPERPTEPKDVLIQTLAMTAKQQQLFNVMRGKHRQLVNRLDSENRVLRDTFFTIIKKTKADTALINTLSKKISDNQALIEKGTLYHFRELRAILTPEQQTKFDGIIAQVVHMVGRPGRMQPHPQRNGNSERPDANGKPDRYGPRPGNQLPPTDADPKREHFGPPPEGMPPPPGPDGKRMPPPDRMPPGRPDGPPPQ